jgi:hypothetical protein
MGLSACTFTFVVKLFALLLPFADAKRMAPGLTLLGKEFELDTTGVGSILIKKYNFTVNVFDAVDCSDGCGSASAHGWLELSADFYTHDEGKACRGSVSLPASDIKDGATLISVHISSCSGIDISTMDVPLLHAQVMGPTGSDTKARLAREALGWATGNVVLDRSLPRAVMVTNPGSVVDFLDTVDQNKACCSSTCINLCSSVFNSPCCRESRNECFCGYPLCC